MRKHRDISPKQQFNSSPVTPSDYQAFELLSLMGAFTFASSLAQTFLCICFVFLKHTLSVMSCQSSVNRLVLAVVFAIIAQVTTTVEYAVRVKTNQNLDQIGWQIWSLGLALIVPIAVLGWRPKKWLFRMAHGKTKRFILQPILRLGPRKRLFGGADEGLIQLAYGSLALAVIAVLMSATFSTQSVTVAENVYITICYTFMVVLGVVLGQCIACLPSVPSEVSSQTSK